MKKRMLVLGSILLIMIFTSCTDPEGATKALQHSGYREIQIGGYGWFQGSKDDFYATKFNAIAPNGEPCSGVVTKGMLFKGSTIRLND